MSEAREPTAEHTEPPADISPLSFFFPELTPDEARAIDGETYLVMERRARVMALYRHGRSIASIAAEFQCHPSTINQDLNAVLEGYKRVAARTMAEHLADALQVLSEREVDIQNEWDRSKSDIVESQTEKSEGKAPRARLKKKQRYGDPRLAGLLLGIWDRRCKLLGLLKPVDFPAQPGQVPTKFISGLDPRELV